MKERIVKLTAEEDARCRQIVEVLFADYLKNRENLCVTKTERYGYLVLIWIGEETFETSAICRSAEELYEELLRSWELDYLYQTGLENGCEDYETSGEGMTAEQQAYREEVREHYRKGMEEIMGSHS